MGSFAVLMAPSSGDEEELRPKGFVMMWQRQTFYLRDCLEPHHTHNFWLLSLFG